MIALVLAGCTPDFPPEEEKEPPDLPPETLDTGAPTDPCGEGEPQVTGGFGDPFVAAPPAGSTVTVFNVTGFLISTSFRAAHIHSNVSVLSSIALVEDGRSLSGGEATDGYGNPSSLNYTYQSLAPDGECAGTASSNVLLYAPGTDGLANLDDLCPLVGEEVEIGWEVGDLEDGRTASASARAFLALDRLYDEACAAPATP